MEYSLESILSPCSALDFRKNIYTIRAELIAGNEKKFEGLFSFADLNTLLNTAPIPHPTMKIVKDAVPVSVSSFNSIIEACKGGASLIIDQIHKYNHNVSKLSSALSYELNEPVQVNMYLGQPGVKGFDRHYDCHDVLIIQTEGQKRWRIFEPTLKFPLFHQKFHGKVAPERPYLDCTLCAGDVLYVPRGHWHEAIATHEQSLHLTVGILAKTGIDFFNWLIDELRENEKFREPLPLILANEKADGKNTTLIKEHIEKLKNEVLIRLGQSDLINTFSRYYIAKEYHYEPFNFPHQVQNMGIQLVENSRIFHIPFQNFEIESKDTSFVLYAFGKLITFKSICEKFVRHIMSNEVVIIKEINWADFSINIEQASKVVDCLVKEGIVCYSNE